MTDAIEVLASANNIIGGPLAGQGNVILGTNVESALAQVPEQQRGPGQLHRHQCRHCRTRRGNAITTDNSASNNTIGGPAAGAGNLISGAGTESSCRMAHQLHDQGNKIGTDITGTLAIPNGNNGIVATTPALGTIIGGTAAGAGNIVATAAATASISRPELSNPWQFDFGTPASASRSTSPLPNDLGDADTGANNFQNYPVLSTASANGETY